MLEFLGILNGNKAAVRRACDSPYRLTELPDGTKERLVPHSIKSPEQATNSIAVVPLTKGMVAIVDAEDAERVLKLKWWAQGCATRPNGFRKWYAAGYLSGTGRAVYLHRFILRPDDGQRIDHVNGDGLDCRKANLRLATRRQNNLNRPQSNIPDGVRPYKGVVVNVRSCYGAIFIGRKMIRSVAFDTAEEAACAYDRMAVAIGGEFAWQNLPELHLDLTLREIVHPDYWERFESAIALYRGEAAA